MTSQNWEVVEISEPKKKNCVSCRRSFLVGDGGSDEDKQLQRISQHLFGKQALEGMGGTSGSLKLCEECKPKLKVAVEASQKVETIQGRVKATERTFLEELNELEEASKLAKLKFQAVLNEDISRPKAIEGGVRDESGIFAEGIRKVTGNFSNLQECSSLKRGDVSHILLTPIEWNNPVEQDTSEEEDPVITSVSSVINTGGIGSDIVVKMEGARGGRCGSGSEKLSGSDDSSSNAAIPQVQAVQQVKIEDAEVPADLEPRFPGVSQRIASHPGRKNAPKASKGGRKRNKRSSSSSSSSTNPEDNESPPLTTKPSSLKRRKITKAPGGHQKTAKNVQESAKVTEQALITEEVFEMESDSSEAEGAPENGAHVVGSHVKGSVGASYFFGSFYNRGLPKEVTATEKNEIIYSSVSQWLPFSDQKVVRSLSKDWCDGTLKFWRSTATLTLTPKSANELYERMKKQGKENWHNNAYNIFYDFEKAPLRNYRIEEETTLALPPLTPEQAMDGKMKKEKSVFNSAYILVKLGAFIHYLDIQSQKVFLLSGFLTGVKWLLVQNCPQLAELIFEPRELRYSPKQTVKDDEMDSKQFGEGRAINLKKLNLGLVTHDYVKKVERVSFTTKLLQLIPNLKVFCVSDERYAERLLSVMKSPLPGDNQIMLTSLELPMVGENAGNYKGLSSDLLLYAEGARPPLQTLKLAVDMKTIRTKPFHFHQFLSCCSQTLTFMELELYFAICPYLWVTDLTGRSFPNLTTLKLSVVVMSTSDIVRFDFSGLKGMQRLKKFHLQTFTGDKSAICKKLAPELLECGEDVGKKPKSPWITAENEESAGLLALPLKLEELEEFYFHLHESISEESLKVIAGWMPSIKRMAFVADPSTFSAALNVFTSLNKLILLYKSSVEKRAAIAEARSLEKNVKIIGPLTDPDTRQLLK